MRKLIFSIVLTAILSMFAVGAKAQGCFTIYSNFGTNNQCVLETRYCCTIENSFQIITIEYIKILGGCNETPPFYSTEELMRMAVHAALIDIDNMMVVENPAFEQWENIAICPNTTCVLKIELAPCWKNWVLDTITKKLVLEKGDCKSLNGAGCYQVVNVCKEKVNGEWIIRESYTYQQPLPICSPECGSLCN